MQPKYTFKQLEALIKPILDKYNADKALLFGSYARGEATSESDIDLIVFGGADFKPTDIFAVAEELHLATNGRVDVYEINELERDTPFYKTVFNEGVYIA